METIYNAGFYSLYLQKNYNEICKAAGFDIKDQTQRLSTFSLITDQDGQEKHCSNELEQSICAVYSNLISRGLPTLPSLLVERSIVETIKKDVDIKEDVINGSFEFNISTQSRKQTKEWLSKLVQAHLPCDPRISCNEFPKGVYDSGAEAIFHTTFLPEKMSRFLSLLVQPQRSVETMLSDQFPNEFINNTFAKIV